MLPMPECATYWIQHTYIPILHRELAANPRNAQLRVPQTYT